MDKIDEKLKTLQPVLGPVKTRKLRQMYFYENDFRQKKEIEHHIDLLISQLVKTGVALLARIGKTEKRVERLYGSYS